MQKLKTAKEISELLNLNQQRIYELTRRDLIPHIKIGNRQYRYSEVEIEKWLIEGGNRETVTNKDAPGSLIAN